jgi:hypothetical protein
LTYEGGRILLVSLLLVRLIVGWSHEPIIACRAELGTHDAKTNVSRIIERVERGEEIVAGT